MCPFLASEPYCSSIHDQEVEGKAFERIGSLNINVGFGPELAELALLACPCINIFLFISSIFAYIYTQNICTYYSI